MDPKLDIRALLDKPTVDKKIEYDYEGEEDG